MSTDVVRVFLKRWWFIGAALFGLGGWAARLESEIEKKVNLDAVAEMQRDITDIKQTVTDIEARQQQWFCEDKPNWCR